MLEVIYFNHEDSSHTYDDVQRFGDVQRQHLDCMPLRQIHIHNSLWDFWGACTMKVTETITKTKFLFHSLIRMFQYEYPGLSHHLHTTARKFSMTNSHNFKF